MNDKPMTKTEVREWVKRIREDLRDIESALRDNDWESVHLAAQDAACAAGEVEYDAETRKVA